MIPPRQGPLRAQLPLLDRLMNAHTEAALAPQPSAAEALEQLHVAVRRDLEALLNARRRRRPLPATLTELASSIATYGIPDPVSGSYTVPELRAELARDVEVTIRRFEPRLSQINVSLIANDDELGATLRLRVEALLRADPTPEPVSFETQVEPITRNVSVRET